MLPFWEQAVQYIDMTSCGPVSLVDMIRNESLPNNDRQLLVACQICGGRGAVKTEWRRTEAGVKIFEFTDKATRSTKAISFSAKWYPVLLRRTSFCLTKLGHDLHEGYIPMTCLLVPEIRLVC